MSADAVRDADGCVLLVPSSIKASHPARALIDRLTLDYLLIDTHPGRNEETLLSIAVSDVLFLVLRPDRQDFQVTAVTAEVARRLGVPDRRLVVNKYAPWLDRDALCRQVEATYGAPVAGMFAHSDEMLELQSGGVFALQYPEHEFSQGGGADGAGAHRGDLRPPVCGFHMSAFCTRRCGTAEDRYSRERFQYLHRQMATQVPNIKTSRHPA